MRYLDPRILLAYLFTSLQPHAATDGRSSALCPAGFMFNVYESVGILFVGISVNVI